MVICPIVVNVLVLTPAMLDLAKIDQIDQNGQIWTNQEEQ